MPRFPTRKADKDALYRAVAGRLTGAPRDTTTDTEINLTGSDRGMAYDFSVTAVTRPGTVRRATWSR